MKAKPLRKKDSIVKIPYRWFLTKSGKLVIGGKSSAQNDELLKSLKKSDKEHIVMHTKAPGSPFCVIKAAPKEIFKEDIEEAAVFTGCFSRAWKQRKKKTDVDIFSLDQLYKTKAMKIGTWGVKGKVETVKVDLELVLTKQDNTLRAVPEITLKRKTAALLKVRPGKNDKTDMASKFDLELDSKFSSEEILAALPAGGVSIVRK